MNTKARIVIFNHNGPISLLAVLAALLFVVATIIGLMDTSAADQSFKPKEGVSPLKLQIAEKRVTGKFDRRPLFEFLDAVREKEQVEYQGPDELLQRKVSGEFHDVPLIEAVREVLASYNYVIVFSAESTVQRLQIMGLREDSLGEGQPGPSPAHQVNEPDNLSFDQPVSLADLELPEEERRLFEIADKKLGPPPELLEAFEPQQELGTEKTGPQVPKNFEVEELPQFEVVVSETGPQGPDVAQEELPEFNPEVNQTGPFHMKPSFQ